MLDIQRQIVKLSHTLTDEQLAYLPALEYALEIVCNNAWHKFEDMDSSVHGLRLELSFKYSSDNRCYQYCVYDDIAEEWQCCNTGEPVSVDNATHWRLTCPPEST